MHLSKDRKWWWIGKGLKKKTVGEVDWKVCIQKLRDYTNQITERTTTESMEHSQNL